MLEGTGTRRVKKSLIGSAMAGVKAGSIIADPSRMQYRVANCLEDLESWDLYPVRDEQYPADQCIQYSSNFNF